MATVHSIYFQIPDLLRRIDREVLYKSRNKDNIDGLGNNSIVDAHPVVKDYMNSICSEIFDKLTSPLSRGFSELDEPPVPYEFDKTFTKEDETTVDNCIIYRVMLPEKYDLNVIPSLMKAIEDCIVSYCIYQWLLDADIKGWQKYEREHERKFDNLRGLVHRRINLKRKYKLF
nr:hypothetical protein [uncultured Draconibacterium sp.]